MLVERLSFTRALLPAPDFGHAGLFNIHRIASIDVSSKRDVACGELFPSDVIYSLCLRLLASYVLSFLAQTLADPD